MDQSRRERIRQILEDFLRYRLARIERLSLDDLDINPFLLRLLSHEMGLNDARSVVEWLVSQRFERGTVTAFGGTLEKIARVFGETTGVEGADLMLAREGRHHYVQVKSGPNTVPKDLATKISELLHSAQVRNFGAVALFGMCYGNPTRVSSIVRRYVTVPYKVGRDFWAFLSGEENCVDQIYAIAAEVSESFRDPKGRSLKEALDEKVNELCDEFIRRYGQTGPEMWEKLLRENS
ncbi:MAG: PmeII family type II restriction endonuclease [Anaerolineae bacterium]|nr:PmeII family type II restriction endonuclease [Anaerolineae bacterium]